MNTTSTIDRSADLSRANSSTLSSAFATAPTLAPLVLRLTLATVMFPHGAQKLLGWFGGYGFTGTMGYFTQSAGLPWLVGFAVILIEFFGPLLLVAGAGTRVAALGIGGVMTGVMLMVNSEFGFFMNWFGNQAGEGIEFSLLAVGIALALVISGGGRYSADRAIADRLANR